MWKQGDRAFTFAEDFATIFQLLQGATQVSILAIGEDADGFAALTFDVRALMDDCD